MYRVEVGVLLPKEDKDNESYLVYDKKYGYYDEDQYYVETKEEATARVREYVSNGVDFTYGLVASTAKEGTPCRNTNLKGEYYGADAVLFSIARINGEVIENFISQ